ncbi:DUF3493 domain-containing protein [Calothrix sp. NIES-3974]|uniref:DUF3493 domain-containing protein n=1 Tax=Calothrix sp. NIES-3974 TaxID=2005462 RepID=UPI000B5ED4E1|nr:DUF3493 domain-containing protein [Calothrix sp. NIES-3974]BAZ08022.1 hypothetical protein NIES3974_46900 [Calothrix sp. NIES-3974]
MVQPNPQNTSGKQIKPEVYARLKAEAAAPYKGLRQFLYIGFAASGLIGGFIFFMQILAGRDVENAMTNLGVQIAVVALMIFLWKRENRR